MIFLYFEGFRQLVSNLKTQKHDQKPPHKIVDCKFLHKPRPLFTTSQSLLYYTCIYVCMYTTPSACVSFSILSLPPTDKFFIVFTDSARYSSSLCLRHRFISFLATFQFLIHSLHHVPCLPPLCE